ncbi:putative transcription factor C2H2 family protein [Tanacetum coccineum]
MQELNLIYKAVIEALMLFFKLRKLIESCRHSNCLDRFKKHVTSDTNDTTATTPPSLIPVNDNSTDANAIGYVELAGESGDASKNISSSPSKSSLKCPLCRGSVSGYAVVEEARQYLNLKQRSCSQESFSAIRSAMPGAVLFGDYAIDNPENRERGLGEGSNNGHWLTALFFFQMISSVDSPSADRRGGARARVPTRGRPRRLYWGETLLGLQDDEGNNDSDEDEDPFRLNVVNDNDEGRHPENPRRRRRRLTRYRSDEDQS